MADFGSQEHCFSPVQRYVTEKADAFFEVTDEDLREAQKRHDEKIEEHAIINAELTGRLISMGKRRPVSGDGEK